MTHQGSNYSEDDDPGGGTYDGSNRTGDKALDRAVDRLEEAAEKIEKAADRLEHQEAEKPHAEEA